MRETKISEDQVAQDYDKGLPEGFRLDKSKIRRKPVMTDEPKVTVQISLKLDADLLEGIKQAATDKGLPYQTFIKQVLKEHLGVPAIEKRFSLLESRVNYLEQKIAL